MLKFLIEYIGTIDVAFSTYTGEGAAEKANRPLIDLFFKIAAETYIKESGESTFSEKQLNAWIFATQFHLPPCIRWLGVRKAPLDSFGLANDYDFWLSFGKRIQMPEGTKTKRVCPGLYATLTDNFVNKPMFDATTIKENWELLISLVKGEGIQIDNRPYIEEHLQKKNDCGWGGFKIMLPIDFDSLPKGMRSGLDYVVPRMETGE